MLGYVTITMTIPRVLLIATILCALLTGCTAAPSYEGEASAHYTGKQFVNRTPMYKGAGDMIGLGWGSLFERADWPEWVEVEQQQIASERVEDGIAVTFINHATFLIQMNGLNILTDPMYSERASPFQFAGPRRVHQPGVALEDLPPIDVILISHNHYDHLDADTLQRLTSRPGQTPLILAGLGNGEYFDELGLENHRDMDWEDRHRVSGVDFIFAECRHRSGRGISDQMKTLWGAFVIKSPAGNIYFAGDTGYDVHFKHTGDAHGPFKLALLPIGAYEPRWFMKDVHVNPAEAVQAHLDLKSEHTIGMHFGTFQLTYEPIDQPGIDLQQALQDQKIDPFDFTVLRPGDTYLTP
jgi:L-ascorbate metabolism protein UlaG (beta-lactamase superfamily)